MRWRAAPALDVGAIAGVVVWCLAGSCCCLPPLLPLAWLHSAELSLPAHRSSAAHMPLSCAPRLCCPPLPPPCSRTLPAAGSWHAGLLRGAHAAGMGCAPHHSGGQLARGLQQPGEARAGSSRGRTLVRIRGCAKRQAGRQAGRQADMCCRCNPASSHAMVHVPACLPPHLPTVPAPCHAPHRCASRCSTLRTASAAASPRLRPLPRR